MTLLVVDAAAIVALLADNGPAGEAAVGSLAGYARAAPELLPFETANVLRWLELAGRTSSETAALAHSDLLDLPLELWPYVSLALGSWQVRGSLTLYDAAYVALAPQFAVPFASLDQRLARAASSSCQVVVPDVG